MDSMLVYRGLDVVTAKPTAEERRAAPIHGLDLVDPSEPFSVARYLETAEALERAIEARGHAVLFVGGTSLYLKALTHGLSDLPGADPALRAELEERGAALGSPALHAELAAADPEAAARIHERDLRRIVRALEVHRAAGRPISSLQREWAGRPGAPRRIVGIRVDRETLHRRIEARIDVMFERGLEEEIRRVAAGGFSREAAAAVGVAEVRALLSGAIDRSECRARMVRRTRTLVRRQETWLRSFPEVRWIDGGDGREADAIAKDAGVELGFLGPGAELDLS